MKRIASIILFLAVTVIDSFSNNADSLLAVHAEGLTKHRHFEADFTQTRYMSLFKKPLVSTGTISFSYPDKILFHYKTPFESVILLIGNTMKRYYREKDTWAEQPSLEIVAKAITKEIMRFLKGKFTENMPFIVHVKKERPRTFSLVPKNEMAKTVFSAIEVTFAESCEYIEKIKLIEQTGDYILVTHKKPSFAPIPDSRFIFSHE